MNLQRIMNCVAAIQSQTLFQPEAALVLGSGLGHLASEIEVKAAISYESLPDFPISTVAGHKGQFLLGVLNGVRVIAMQGRVHYYEGYEMEDVVLPIRVMGKLGARLLILTNAAGGINSAFSPGDLMMITGQIGTLVPSPLRGKNEASLGTRFPDLSEIYDRELRTQIQTAAKTHQIPLQSGVYLQTCGPQYETPEEIRMFAMMGADAVGMSTACEAIAARHMGLRVCGISCITNAAAGISKTPLSHEEVQASAALAEAHFCKLIRESLPLLRSVCYD